MPTTLEALAVALLAIVPGAAFIWGMERLTGAWGIKATDRVLRFLGFSVFIHILISPLTYYLWTRYIHSGHIGRGEPLPYWLYQLAILYVLLPFLLGSIAGYAVVNGNPWAVRLFGYQARAPRAWDALFAQAPVGYMRILLKTEPPRWIAGAYITSENGRRSASSIYPETEDLYLAVRLQCDPDTGAFDFRSDGTPIRQNGGILIRREDVLYFEFLEM
jgi:Family of unknown function (DUF6338)